MTQNTAPTPTPPSIDRSDPDTLRVGDADRDSVVAVLGRHAGDGYLTMDELEERSSHALAAKTRADLRGLLSDLPATPGTHSPAVSWAGAVPDGKPARSVAASTEARVEPAKPKRTTLLGRMYDRCSTLLTVGGLCTGIWLCSGGGYFWPVWVIVPLGVLTVL